VKDKGRLTARKEVVTWKRIVVRIGRFEVKDMAV
jgi:hypothetical protein